jgi:hypothetical protein
MPTTEEPLWETTTVQNLIRYRPSGTYFARFKVGGKPIRQSLDTAVFSVAKQRLPDKMREYRSQSVHAWQDDRGRCDGSLSSEGLRKRVAQTAVKLQLAGSDINRSGVFEDRGTPFVRRRQDAALSRQVLKLQGQELFPPRTPGNRIHDFVERLGTSIHVAGRTNPGMNSNRAFFEPAHYKVDQGTSSATTSAELSPAAVNTKLLGSRNLLSRRNCILI